MLESGTEITESDSSSSLQGEGDVADSEGDNAEDAEPVVEAGMMQRMRKEMQKEMRGEM